MSDSRGLVLRLTCCVVAALALSAAASGQSDWRPGEDDAAPAATPAANGPVSLLAPGAARTRDATADEALPIDPTPAAAEGAAPRDEVRAARGDEALDGGAAAAAHQPLGGAGSAEGAARDGASAPVGAASATPDRTMDAVRVLGALAAVLGLILMLRVIVRRVGGSWMGGPTGGARPSGVCEVLARYPVGRGQQLILLKLARRLLLVHQSGAAMRTLSEMTEPEEVAAVLARVEAGSRRGGGAFRRSLQRFEVEHRMRDGGRPAVFASGGEQDVVDLTQNPHAALRRLLEAKRA